MSKLKKRKWIYIHHPLVYEMRCDKCWDKDENSNTGMNIAWSEFEGCIWCYDCKIDTPGFGGLFDGPIPIGITKMLGISFFRAYFKSKNLMKPVTNKKGKIIYRRCSTKEVDWAKKPMNKRLNPELNKYIKLVPKLVKEK